MLAGAGVPASDMHLGRVAGSADAVPASLTLEPTNPSVSVRVSNTTGKPGRVVGWLGGRAATAVAPDHSAIVTLTWDEQPDVTADPGVLRLELYPEGDSKQPTDVEEHPFAFGGGYYHQPQKPNKPGNQEQPKEQPKAPVEKPVEKPAAAEVLPLTGSQTSTIAVFGGGSVLLGMFVLGLAWALRRRRSVRDQLS
jgi:LPXTG-motif cell wall-anchored protein